MALDGVRDWLNGLFGRDRTVIPLVRLHGVIAPDPRPGRLNIASVEPMLARAFRMKTAPLVAIAVNSPGGSPVQSRLISKRIRDLAHEHGKPVLVFVEDAAASGGYFIAVAGDEILVDPSSIVGSIGVVAAGFGFVEAIEKLGVTRRVYTAGRSKAMLDPFLPEKKEEVDRLRAAETDIHGVFIEHVKARRGGRLKAPDEILFTGEWWTGRQALTLGLVDAMGDVHGTLHQRFGDNIRIKVIEPRRGFFNLPRLGLQSASAGGLLDDAIGMVEDRAWWGRLGL